MEEKWTDSEVQAYITSAFLLELQMQTEKKALEGM